MSYNFDRIKAVGDKKIICQYGSHYESH